MEIDTRRATAALMQRPILRYVFAFLAVFMLGIYSFYPYNIVAPIDHLPIVNTDSSSYTSLSQPPAIAMMTMLYGTRNTIYEQAIKSHERHAFRQGLPIHILQNPVASGFWNKPSYILSLLIAELSKPPSQRATWLMWVDGDSIIIDPELRSDIFLPPPDFPHINHLVSKDQNGMNTGIFFLRVCEWSIKYMAKSLAYPLFHPSVDLGRSADQTAMELVAHEPDFQPHILYQPRIWYNTYEFAHGYEGTAGRLLVHFPGLEEDRWEHMQRWLEIIEDPVRAAQWRLPLNETEYPAEIKRFWAELREARKATNAAQWWIGEKGGANVPADLVSALDRARAVAVNETDDVDAVGESTRWLNEALVSAKQR